MRIISGLNKGKKLIMPKDKTTRPLKDMAKESIFNVLSHANYINFHLKDSKVLDLFSGIGSFGLECISRGSKLVFFDAFEINKDIFQNNQKFQIIFCDPPYKEKKIELLIKNIIEMDILEKNGIIVIHRKKGDLDRYPKKFEVIDIKSYGLSTFVFGKKSN